MTQIGIHSRQSQILNIYSIKTKYIQHTHKYTHSCRNHRCRDAESEGHHADRTRRLNKMKNNCMVQQIKESIKRTRGRKEINLNPEIRIVFLSTEQQGKWTTATQGEREVREGKRHRQIKKNRLEIVQTPNCTTHIKEFQTLPPGHRNDRSRPHTSGTHPTSALAL